MGDSSQSFVSVLGFDISGVASTWIARDWLKEETLNFSSLGSNCGEGHGLAPNPSCRHREC